MDKPFFCFTGRPISDNLFDILKRLTNNIDVPVEEIESTPEFEMGRSMCEIGEETINKPNRELIRQDIIENILNRGSLVKNENKIKFTGEVKKEKILDIVIGLPASGKSSAVVEVLSKIRNAKIIDNDEVKKQIKEFNNGWGAGLVHRESKLLNAVIFEESLKNGDNIILPKVGGYELDIRNIIDESRKYGYKVNLHYVELNRNLAMLRLLTRFITEGRFLSPNLIYQDNNNIIGNKIKNTYNNLINDNYIDGYTMWDNEVAMGEPPILLDCKNIPDKVILEIISSHLDIDTSKKAQKERIQNIVSGEMILSKKIFGKMKDNNFICKIDFEDPEKMFLLLKAIELNMYKKGFEDLTSKELQSIINNGKIEKEEDNLSSPLLDDILKQLANNTAQKNILSSNDIENEIDI